MAIMSRPIATTLAIMALSACATTQSSWAGVALFKDYLHDSPLAHYPQSVGYYPCPAPLGENTLCRDGIDFADVRFSAVLHFNNARLAQITLTRDLHMESLGSIQAALSHSFTLLSLHASTSSLDLVELEQMTPSDEAYTQTLQYFERNGLKDEHLVYVYAEGIHLGTGAKNAKTAYTRTHEHDRLLEVVLSGGALDIAFSLPKLKTTVTAPH